MSPQTTTLSSKYGDACEQGFVNRERKKEPRHPAMLYHRKSASIENLLPFKISTYNPSKNQVGHFIKLKDERSEFSRILFEIKSF